MLRPAAVAAAFALVLACVGIVTMRQATEAPTELTSSSEAARELSANLAAWHQTHSAVSPHNRHTARRLSRQQQQYNNREQRQVMERNLPSSAIVLHALRPGQALPPGAVVVRGNMLDDAAAAGGTDTAAAAEGG
eukprot:CAMPEP_0173393598 /NCGR_PEP_ID=MMETSP1356-20130122/22205_1 /TAXON_ID=77927 ORGANISM="Hemiselmis virescens, Strain PCC157" /NCGR_SAMPLE_ID=MMETSP1356 /ASSEMBLY_ACC=CAM_ASM_000847 /LENGTH=134 /DNA_ID=CAMNT_0014351643 /DNA_START=33 /DNA_END=433 /DNA_ORIENTATION=+